MASRRPRSALQRDDTDHRWLLCRDRRVNGAQRHDEYVTSADLGIGSAILGCAWAGADLAPDPRFFPRSTRNPNPDAAYYLPADDPVGLQSRLAWRRARQDR